MTSQQNGGKRRHWSPLFAAPMDERMVAFNASVRFDRRLAEVDIEGSLAHADMLAACGIISPEDGEAIARGLRQVREEIRADNFEWREEDEDVHLNIERRLVEIIGDAGQRLHTARSRNDQVATDLRLYARGCIDRIRGGIGRARRAILQQAESHTDTLTAGFTHLQTAQPIVFAHHLLAYDDMLRRDDGRFADCRRRLNVLPLGAGALAGVGYAIDRRRVAAALGFDGICENAMDAVSDRDFAIEFAAAAAVCMMHLSRFCEETILWCSPPFACAVLGDSFCTGSSIMPQKKNPDAAELIRGKTGRAAGAVMALLMLMKGQPLAYNKDNQEDKEPFFDSADTAISCLDVFAAMIENMQFDKTRMRDLLESGYPTATELADYLTKNGMPFRQAHHVTAAVVRELQTAGRRLDSLQLAELQKHAPEADAGALEVLSAEQAVKLRKHEGGTAPDEVRRQIKMRWAEVDKAAG